MGVTIGSAETGAPRVIALDLLSAVLHRRRPFEDALDQHPDFTGLAARDRAFVYRLVATSLRRCGQIDDLIGRCLEHPLGPSARPVTNILRLGAAQLLFLDTPPHAAIDTAVDLAGGRLGRYRGLINAVLRRLSRDGPGWRDAQDAARLNTRDWLWQSWCAAYGETVARDMAGVHLAEPPLDLTPKSADPELAADLAATVLPTGAWRLVRSGAVRDLAGYDDGRWWVQDMAAGLPARLLGDVAGRDVIDLCAAPGGKTAQLAAAGARVTAVEISKKRAGRLQTNLHRLDLTAECVIDDAKTWRPPAPAERVLLDAPCTATGTIRRHPDIAHLKRPADVEHLIAVQNALLANAVEMLALDGLLVYAVCSLQPEEGGGRIADLLENRSDLQRVPVTPGEVGGLAAAVTADGDLRTLPCHWADRGGMDGFYAARLRKTA